MLLSAVIAYVADGAGRKLGKKRLTLLGLRPKHTAILITTTTGALIALFSFGVLMMASSGIRTALSRFDEIRDQNRILTTERSNLQSQTKALGDRVSRLSEEVRASDRQVRDSREAARRARLDLAAAERSRRDAVTAKQAALADLAAQRVALGTLRAVYREKQALLEKAQVRLAAAQAEYARQQKLVIAARQEVARLTAANQSLRKENRQAGYDLRMAKADLRSVSADLAMQHSKLAQARTDLAEARRETEEARTRLTLAQDRVAQMTAGRLVVAKGDELARIVVPAGVDLPKARQLLKDALSAAGAVVLEENRRLTDRIFPVSKQLVAVTPRTVTEETPGGGSREREFSPSQVQEGVAQTLAESGNSAPNGVVVSIVATENVVAGDTALVDFALFNNRLVFKESEEIATTSIDPRFSKETIMDDVVAALRDKVAPEAARRGLMRSRDNALVSLRPEQLADLLNAIKGPADAPRQQPVTVRFLAAGDTWTAGPLSLRLQVVP